MKLTEWNKKRADRDLTSGWVERGFDLSAIMDDFITGDRSRPSFSNTRVSTPAVNIIETPDDFRLEMVAPGMKKKDFNVELQENVLTISYDHEDNREGERRDWKYRAHEYNYHSFIRSFSLPETVIAEKIQATYEDGILNLILPKKDEAKGKPRRHFTVS
jgi:HSP20 family protein